jgi:hypothetical protein
MTKTTDPSATTRGSPSDCGQPDLRRENDTLRAQLDRLQPLYASALLTATAFRLRDRNAETRALRMLVEAIDGLEECVSEC